MISNAKRALIITLIFLLNLNFFLFYALGSSLPSIYPPPKELDFTGKDLRILNRSGKVFCAIVIKEDPSSEVLTGVEEINRKIFSLAGTELPILSPGNPNLNDYKALIFIDVLKDNKTEFVERKNLWTPCLIQSRLI
jgi:hypothetical protein